ncbi:MAG: molybdate ABC transporter substrate-binding protein [Coriobacteriia bacterium]|nr:molybdate ABC transporter substrate-binding protein [Coriobacteriia bacterium]
MKKSRAIVAGIATFALVGALGMFGCSGGSNNGGSAAPKADAIELQIFAANSLEKALPEVQALYTKAHPEVTFSDTQFKASGDLVTELKGGATADLLITASGATMDDAEAAKAVDTATRTDMFTNELVVVQSIGAKVQATKLEDLKKIDGKIAVGEPSVVPAGKYANQALASVGLYSNPEGVDGKYDESIAKKIVEADKVGTACQYVASGDCAVGFVYTSDLYRYEGVDVAFTTPSDSHKPIKYPGAVCTTTKNADTAADFMNFCLTDADAQKVWATYGFEMAAK